jgi:pimeloyl-ACP methyl ester carboxylesterase
MRGDGNLSLWAGRMLAVIVAGAAALVAGCNGAGTKGLIPPPPVEMTSTFVRTADGWDLEMRHYRIDLMDHSRAPVILCHGLGANGAFFDIDYAVSLARYLAEQGYDVWVPSLRGAGLSTKSGFSVVRQLVTLRLPRLDTPIQAAVNIIDPRKWDWTFDDYVHKDLPVLIEHVRKASGHDRVVWLGHSMGGMVMYAYLLTEHPQQIESFVAFASPITLLQPTNEIYREAVANHRLLSLGQILVNASLSSAVGSVSGVQIRDFVYYNRANISPIVLRIYLLAGVEDVPLGVVDQLMEVARTGELKSVDKKVNYTARIPEITVPILLLAGQVDNMCPLDTVRDVYEHIGSKDKTYRVFGLANLYSVDYGHGDMVLGTRARDEVFPYIAKWLEKHDGRPAREGAPAGENAKNGEKKREEAKK